MHLLIEEYPEFEQDVKELWSDFIIKNNLQVNKVGDSVKLSNDHCILQLDLNVYNRMHYLFQNPETRRITSYITLAIYFGMYPVQGYRAGEEEYPLTWGEWLDLYAEDDFRSICRVDLPIILEEIERSFQFVIDGDFSWEKNLDKWQEWYDSNHKPGIPYLYKKLSYKHFQEATNRSSI